MQVLIGIIGGVALLLWGIRMVRTGITRSFGAEFRKALSVSARNRLIAFAAGLGVTVAIQSSAATGLIVSSFAGRGLIAGVAGLAIMLGADVGTTLVAQILSFDLRWLSPLALAIGVFTFLASEKSRRRSLARSAIGLGLILLSLQMIVAASAPLRDSETFILLLKPLAGEPALAVIVAAAVTWAAHSSLAMVLLIMSLTTGGVLGIEVALAMVLGANLGGAMIAVGATMREPAAARRIPLGNLIMRAVAVAAMVPLLGLVQPYLALISEYAGEYGGDGPARMIVNFHTAFNVALALLFLPLLDLVDGLTKRLIVDKSVQGADGQPLYLDAASLDTPTVALACATRETLRMGDEVKWMLQGTMTVLEKDDAGLMQQVEDKDDTVDQLHEAIKLYLTKLAREELDDQESSRNIEILSFTTNLEHIGDIIDKNLMELANKKIKAAMSFSTEGAAELQAFHASVLANLDLALNVFISEDLPLARRLLREKTMIRDQERRLVANHFARMSQGRPESIESSSLHLDILRDLKRISSHLTSVAYPILDRAGELATSRLVEIEK